MSGTLLDMHEAASFLGIDYDTLRAYVKAGIISAVRYPSLVKGKQGRPRRKKLFRIETLQQFIIDCETADTATSVFTKSATKVSTKPPVATTRNYPKGWYKRYGTGERNAL